jgi:predicted RecA/RadA family phage recombinase
MRNFIQRGEVITMTAPTGGILSGAGAMFGALFGVAQFDAAQATPVEVATEGVFSLPKPNTVVAFTVGERIFWDNATGLCKKTASGFFPIGIATVAAGATDATVAVRLDGNSVVAA